MKFSLLEGFSVKEISSHLSPIIARTYADRKSLMSNSRSIIFTEIRGTPKDPVLVFLAEPTYNFRMPIVSFGRPKKELEGVAYEILLKLENFSKWRKGKYLWQMDVKEFKEVLSVVDIKLDCQCMAFHWTGIRYQLSQIDVALFPTSISDNYWRLRHTESGVPTVCKHIKGVFDILNKNSSQILKAIKIKYSNPQRVARIKKLKNINTNIQNGV